MKVRSYFRIAALATLFAFVFTGIVMAKPGEQKPLHLGSKGALNVDVAITAWKTKQKDDETTAAFRKRVTDDLRKLLQSDLAKIHFDSNYWRLLAYLREHPWERLPSRWQNYYLENMPNPRLTDEQREALVKRAEKKPFYELKPKELDAYLSATATQIPDLRQRVVHYARKGLNQPYSIYLLGEYPYEIYDADPLYCLDTGDCVVFSEHVYAMSLSRNWKEFFATLQKLRYKNGEVGMTTRNHYTEADWNKNNSWIVEDATESLGATTVTAFSSKIDRAAFFAKFGVGQDIAVQEFSDVYIPAEAIESVLPKLQDGDFVNIVRGHGTSPGAWVGHVGLIGHGKDGTVNFIHSTEPKSVEQPIMEYVNKNLERNKERAKKGQAQFRGMKFLRLRADELQKELASKPVPE